MLSGAFVATEVDVLVGEDFCKVVHDALEEVNHTVVANVEHVVRDTSGDAYFILLGGVATEFGVSCYGCHHVTGKVNFGHNLDVACKGIINDFL